MFVPRIWGARSLAPLYPEKSNLPEAIGEVWLTGVDCKVATGPFAGKTLGEAWSKITIGWRGTSLQGEANFPLLLKFIFPKDKLSIQVHPDDAYAAAYEQAAGGRGKTEMWYVVSAEHGARLLVGLKPGTTKESFGAALANHELEDLFQAYEVRAGDTFFVPAGMPHTIGPGIIICEVQEYSDLTYRVYDYGRVDSLGKPRELHIKKALDVIQLGRPVAGKVSRITLPAHGVQRVLLAACRYFATERWKNFAQVEIHSDSQHFCLLVILSGSGDFSWPGSSVEYQTGECWLISAGLGPFRVHSKEPTKLLRTYVPDLTTLKADLCRQGLSEFEIAKTVFD
jgi:mannose-6-phosphate isomerase